MQGEAQSQIKTAIIPQLYSSSRQRAFYIFLGKSYLHRLKQLFHCSFFQEISLFLLIESSSSYFPFFFYLSDSMNLGEKVICCGSEWLFLCGSNPV